MTLEASIGPKLEAPALADGAGAFISGLALV